MRLMGKYVGSALLVAAGMYGLGTGIPYSGWVLAAGLIAVLGAVLE